jgi:hypothetical protein
MVRCDLWKSDLVVQVPPDPANQPANRGRGHHHGEIAGTDGGREEDPMTGSWG